MGTLHILHSTPRTDQSMPPSQPLEGSQLPDDGARWGAWMARAQAGDTASYHALLQAIVPYVRAIARRHLGSNGELEDAVQDVLILVHDIRHTYEPARPFKPWLGTIASRRCIDIVRQRTRRTRREVFDDTTFDHLSDPGDGPERALERAQQARAVRSAVQRLSPKMQDAVQRVHFQELSHDEAAQGTSNTPGAIKVACHRALKTLKTAIGAGRHDHD